MRCRRWCSRPRPTQKVRRSKPSTTYAPPSPPTPHNCIRIGPAAPSSGPTGRPQERLRVHKGVLRDRVSEDLKRFDVPTLIVHGDDDQIVPIVASAYRSSKLVENATLKVYEGAPHGLPVTHTDRLNEDLLAFIKE